MARGLALVVIGCAVLGLQVASGGARTAYPSPPGCSSATASARALRVRPEFVPTHGSSFRAVPGGRFVFLSLPGDVSPPAGVAVLSHGKVERIVKAAGGLGPLGMVLAPPGRYLVAADGVGVSVYSVSKLVGGASQAQVLRVRDGGDGAIDVALTSDGRYAFVSDEYSETITALDFGGSLRTQHPAARRLGAVRVRDHPVGLALAPGGRYLYVADTTLQGETGKGSLSVLDVAKTIAGSTSAVVATAPAGCGPSRVVLAPGGKVVWVTARASNALIALDAARLRAGRRAVLAVERVGSEPVGVALADAGRLALVANSARFTDPFGNQTISVVDTQRALAGKPALVGSIPAGEFPREITVAPNGNVLVTNYGSATLETFTTDSLRAALRSRR